jgi:hypothetical protein
VAAFPASLFEAQGAEGEIQVVVDHQDLLRGYTVEGGQAKARIW